MEGSKRRTGAVRRVERSFECSRLAEQLLISAYELVVPVIRQAVRHRPSAVPASEATKTSSAIGAARP